MRSILAGIRQLVLPWGASSTSPRIVIGPDVPPELQVRPGGRTIVAAIIWYANADRYHWYGVETDVGTGANPGIVRGTRNEVAGVQYTDAYNLDPASNTWFISQVDGSGLPTLNMNIQGARVLIGGTGAGVGPKGTPFKIDGVDAPRGLVGYTDADVATAAIGAETMIGTIPANVTFRDGRCYEIRWKGVLQGSVANTATIRAKINGIANTRGEAYYPLFSAGNFGTCDGMVRVRNTTGADIVQPVGISLQANAGTVTMVGAANRLRTIEVWDCGAAADFAKAAAV